MAHNGLQIINIAAVPQVVDGKGMAEGMRAYPDIGNFGLFTVELYPFAEGIFVHGVVMGRDKNWLIAIKIGHLPEVVGNNPLEGFTDGYGSLFIPFA